MPLERDFIRGPNGGACAELDVMPMPGNKLADRVSRRGNSPSDRRTTIGFLPIPEQCHRKDRSRVDIKLDPSPVSERMVDRFSGIDGASEARMVSSNKLAAALTEPKSSPALKFVAPRPNKA